MKVLVATDKPFAKVAVDGIRKEIEAAGYELVLLEKYGEKAKLLEAVKDANAIIPIVTLRFILILRNYITTLSK